MVWTEDTYQHFQPYDPHTLQILPVHQHSVSSATVPPGREPHYSPISPPQAPQQPTTILQQLPDAMMPPGSAPSIRPCGHVKDDLVELMMIQNAQMHQVIMNNMTMSALSSFGYSSAPPAPAATRNLVVIQEEEEDPEVYHHYYQPAPYLSYPAWPPQPLPQPTLVYQDPSDALETTPSLSHRDRQAVPPPPPPSATRTVGADIPPAAEYYNATEGR